MLICGVDPGASGGLVFIKQDHGIVSKAVMPLEGKDVSAGGIRSLFTAESGHDFMNNIIVVIESAQSMPKQGVASMFRYGKNFGVLLGVVGCLRLPYFLVKPREWQKEMFKGVEPGLKPKERAYVSACRTFPKDDFIATPKSKKPHLGLIDAALIAEWGIRYFGNKDTKDIFR